MAGEQLVRVANRELRLRNLDKVMYPATETTKAEVIAYYSAVAPLLLPQLRARPVTRYRWPDGVAASGFFEKQVPRGTPTWLATVRLPVTDSTMDRSEVEYALVEDLPALVWLANMAALELHTPQWRVPVGYQPPNEPISAAVASDFDPAPDRIVIDLDPGPEVSLAQCAQIAVAVKEYLRADDLDSQPVTSGRHGIHVYASCPRKFDNGEQSSQYVRRLAHTLTQALPQQVTIQMAKNQRRGKVFIDWSQNVAAKTTVTPFSLRGASQPQVAAPRTWEELTDPRLGQLTMEQVMQRVSDGHDWGGFTAA